MGYSWLTNNVVIVSGEQFQPCIYMYPFSPKLPSPSRLPRDIEQGSMCYTVGPCWLSILNTALCTCQFYASYSFPQPYSWASQVVLVVKNSLVNTGDTEDGDSILGLERSTGEGNINPLQNSCLKKSPWTKEPGGLQSMGSQRVVYDWATEHARTLPLQQP